MTMIATIDDEPISLRGDWHAFAEWGRTFAGDRKQLRHLAEFRWSQDLIGLATDLDAVLIETRPTPEVEEFAERLLDELEGRQGAEVLAISDGPERAAVSTFRELQWDGGDGTDDGLEWCLEV